MRIPLPAAKRRARIEIIPLIDVVFFLLATFVMVSMSMVKNQGISVDLPRASTGSSSERKESVTVTVTENGQIYLNKERMSTERLKSKLTAMKNRDPELKVFINGDEKAAFGLAVGLLDEIRKLGISKVSIQTRPVSDANTA